MTARAASALLLASLAGCVMEMPDAAYSRCDAIDSSDWKAEVEIFPSSHRKPIMHRRLVVTGRVTVPSGGYSVALEAGPVAELDPPVQQMMVRTTGPAAPATQALVTHDVRAVIPALKRYGGVEIRCGDGIIARLAEVVQAAE